MSKAIAIQNPTGSVFKNIVIMREVAFLSLATILLSVGIIWFHNRIMFNEQIYELYSQVELAGITFMPYMISAVIAALTSLYIMNYIPQVRSKVSSHQIAQRIREFGEGDLVSFARIQTDNSEINEIARELSFTVAQWNSQMAQMKIINRQQWDLLQEVKQSSLKKDTESILKHLEKIEENWIKTAEIEELIRT